MIGGGTVLQPHFVDELAALGGKLIVTPNTNPAVIRRAVELGQIVAAGVATPTECFAALEAGAQTLKVFPAGAFGPDYIKAIRAVLPASTPVMAVGGVTPLNLKDFFARRLHRRWPRQRSVQTGPAGQPHQQPGARLYRGLSGRHRGHHSTMKITRITTYRVPPRWMFLKIETDEGLVGWGEPVLEGRAKTVEAAVHEMSEYLVGQDPARINDLWQVLYRAGFFIAAAAF